MPPQPSSFIHQLPPQQQPLQSQSDGIIYQHNPEPVEPPPPV